MDKLSSFISNLYGLLLILGGIMGYIKVHSKPSIIMGVISGILILLATKVGANKPKAGYLYIASLSLVLAMFFSVRFAQSHAFMPAGLMLILSTITYVFVARGWLKS